MSSVPLGVTPAAQWLKTIWGAGINVFFEQKGTLKNLTRDVSAFATGSATMKVPLLADCSATAKAEGTAVTYMGQTATAATFTFAHYDASEQVEDIVVVESNPDLMSAYQQNIGYALRKTYESVIATAIQGKTPVALNADNTLTEAEVRTAVTALYDASVDPSDCALICSPLAAMSILDLDVYTLYDNTGQRSAQVDGFTGKYIMGMPIIVNNNWSDALDTDTVTASIVHKDSVGHAQQLFRFQKAYNLPYLAWDLVGDISLAAAVLKTGGVYNWDNP